MPWSTFRPFLLKLCVLWLFLGDMLRHLPLSPICNLLHSLLHRLSMMVSPTMMMMISRVVLLLGVAITLLTLILAIRSNRHHLIYVGLHLWFRISTLLARVGFLCCLHLLFIRLVLLISLITACFQGQRIIFLVSCFLMTLFSRGCWRGNISLWTLNMASCTSHCLRTCSSSWYDSFSIPTSSYYFISIFILYWYSCLYFQVTQVYTDNPRDAYNGGSSLGVFGVDMEKEFMCSPEVMAAYLSV